MAEQVDALRADLEWRANTGTVKAEVASLRRDFHSATAGMSSDTLKLTVAQDKLDKALLRHGPASTQAKQAELAYRREVETSTAQVRRHDAALAHDQRTLTQSARGAVAGSGAFRSLGRSIAFASGAYLGTAGLIFAVKSSVNAASNLSEQINKNDVVFEQSAQGILDWSKTTATGIGVARDQALEATGVFGNMLVPLDVAPSKAAQMSRALVELAADMASFNNASPEETLAALRSGLAGEVEPLRKFGVSLSEIRLKQEAIDKGLVASDFKGTLDARSKALAAYALIFKDTQKAQGDYARTSDGLANSQRTLSAEIRDTQAALGTALLPAVTDVTHSLRDWLANSENQARIQRDVNEAVKTGGEVAHGLATGLEDILTVAQPVVDALGGIENAAKLALVVGLALQARKAALSFGLIQSASAATRTRIVEDAAVESAALDGVGASAGRAGGKLRGLRGGVGGAAVGLGLSVAGSQLGGQGGSALSTIGNFTIGGSVLFGAPGAIVGAGVGGALSGINSGKSEAAANKARWNQLSYAKQQEVLRTLGPNADAFLKAFELTEKKAPISAGLKGRPEEGSRSPGSVSKSNARTTPLKPGGATGDGLSTLQRLLVAEATPGNDLGDARALLAYYASVVKNGKLTGDKLYQARIDVANQQSKVQSILDGIASDKAAADAKRQATIDRQNAASKRAKEKLVEAVRRANSSGPYATTSEGFSSAGKSPAEAAAAAAKKAAAADAGPTKADIASAVRNAIAAQVSIQQHYAPNFQTGRLETHGFEAVTEARRQTAILEDLARRGGFPASAYSQVSAEAAGS